MPSITGPIEFPAELTVAQWKENTDITKPQHTGIKGQLTKIKTAFDKVNWNTFRARAMCAKNNGVLCPSHVDAKLLDVKEEYRKNVLPLRNTCLEASRKAGEVKEKLKKKTLVRKKNREQVEKIEEAALNFATALKDNSIYFTQVFKDFEAEKDRLQRILDVAVKANRNSMVKLLQDAKDLKQDPTVKRYKGEATTGFYQQCRAVSANMAMLVHEYPRLVPLREKWKRVSNDPYLPKSDEEVEGKLNEVLGLVRDTKAIVW